jgi:type II secretory pathway pseudopilin PulG
VAVAVALFGLIMAFALPRVAGVNRASADAKAKSSLNSVISAEVDARTTALRFVDAAALEEAVPGVTVQGPAVASTAPDRVSLAVSDDGRTAAGAAKADGPTCWMARLSGTGVVWAISDTATCSGSTALSLVPDEPDGLSGSTPDRPFQR